MEHLVMRFKSSKILYSYWDELRGSRIAPRRFEIEPSRIADILPETFILERIGSREIRFRLAGTRVCDRLGGQFRGANFLSCWSKEDRLVLAEELDRISEKGAVLVADVEAQYGEGLLSHFEFLILPLIHTNMRIDRFLGVVSTSLNHCSQGFGTRAALKLRETRLHWPVNSSISSAQAAEEVRETQEMEKPPVFEPHIRHARIVRHDRRSFRVYEGGLSQQGKTDR